MRRWWSTTKPFSECWIQSRFFLFQEQGSTKATSATFWKLAVSEGLAFIPVLWKTSRPKKSLEMILTHFWEKSRCISRLQKISFHLPFFKKLYTVEIKIWFSNFMPVLHQGVPTIWRGIILGPLLVNLMPSSSGNSWPSASRGRDLQMRFASVFPTITSDHHGALSCGLVPSSTPYYH